MTWLIEILKDLTRRTASDKILHDVAFNIANLASMVYVLIKKNPSGNMSNQEFAKGLHKPIIRKFQNKKYTHLL